MVSNKLITPNYDMIYKRAARYFRAKLRLTRTLDVTAVLWGQSTGLHVARIIGTANGRTVQVDVPMTLEDLTDNLQAHIEPIQARVAALFEEQQDGN
jgi:hypothetical protein